MNQTDMDNNDKPAEEAALPASHMGIYDWLQCIVSAVVIGILLFVFIGRINGIEGPSMMQTLQNGDRVILSNLFFTPKYGDVVFIKTDAYGETPLVKRVIATAGQTVDINFETGIVSVDGKALTETYTNTPTNLREDFSGPVIVPPGCIFVMGDNRNDSTDSRSSNVGFVDTRVILGKVWFVLIPGAGYDGHRDFGRIGFVH
jgi:signal peptidase I